MAESSDTVTSLVPELWLLSEDGDVKYLLPVAAVEAYLPLMKTQIDPALSSAKSGNLKPLIVLDGMSGALLEKIGEYLTFHFGNQSANDDPEAWRKKFVASLSYEMLTMLKKELEKRKVTGEVMMLLKEDLIERKFSHWKARNLSACCTSLHL